MLSRRTIRGPVTGLFQTPVCTVRPRHGTSLGRPTFTETSVAIVRSGSAGTGRVRCVVLSAGVPDLFRGPPLPAVERGDVARVPRLAQPRGAEIPVGTDLARGGAEVAPEVVDGRAAPEPVPVVDAVDHEARLQHEGVRDHRVVRGVRVLLDVEVLLDHAAGVREERPVGADRGAELLEGVALVRR